MAEPTHAEAARLLRRMHSAGTVRRLDLLARALVLAYRMGRRDLEREQRGEVPADDCLG